MFLLLDLFGELEVEAVVGLLFIDDKLLRSGLLVTGLDAPDNFKK